MGPKDEIIRSPDDFGGTLGQSFKVTSMLASLFPEYPIIASSNPLIIPKTLVLYGEVPFLCTVVLYHS
ncbi:hypothetical protein AX774_g1682 [Zancudomyces culisetae]|uniref:Uncharacterized protein n=1 Tax=Zancudomyces culisetae TaxID=1213189 RepID=A0A1R1PUX1_ZANCU|nr:hypothetical protein AX774_g1682 [Zancudomyces culisetae]|eukprot:OMH84775.1 hypothetical protein AX774_g1682 [Zancudomyces culisetae]